MAYCQALQEQIKLELIATAGMSQSESDLLRGQYRGLEQVINIEFDEGDFE